MVKEKYKKSYDLMNLGMNLGTEQKIIMSNWGRFCLGHFRLKNKSQFNT